MSQYACMCMCIGFKEEIRYQRCRRNEETRKRECVRERIPKLETCSICFSNALDGYQQKSPMPQTHRHRDTETQRHTDTQTHRHTDTQTHRHTDTYKAHSHVQALRQAESGNPKRHTNPTNHLFGGYFDIHQNAI